MDDVLGEVKEFPKKANSAPNEKGAGKALRDAKSVE